MRLVAVALVIGGVSTATIGVLLRSLVQLEDGGGTEFFGEPQFEIADLLRLHGTPASALTLELVDDELVLESPRAAATSPRAAAAAPSTARAACSRRAASRRRRA